MENEDWNSQGCTKKSFGYLMSANRILKCHITETSDVDTSDICSFYTLCAT